MGLCSYFHFLILPQDKGYLHLRTPLRSARRFLIGNIKCSVCGYTLSPEEQRGKNYYRCTQYGGKHGAQYVSEEILKNQFAKAFKNIQLDKKTAEKVLKDLRDLNETSYGISKDLIKHLISERESINNRMLKLLDDKYDESITNELYEKKNKQYQSQLDEIERKLTNVQKVDRAFYVTANLIVELAKHSAELFKRSEPHEAQLLIKTVLQNVTWDGKKLHYDYLEPFNLLVNLEDSTVWGGRWDSNPQPSVPQTDALTN